MSSGDQAVLWQRTYLSRPPPASSANLVCCNSQANPPLRSALPAHPFDTRPPQSLLATHDTGCTDLPRTWRLEREARPSKRQLRRTPEKCVARSPSGRRGVFSSGGLEKPYRGGGQNGLQQRICLRGGGLGQVNPRSQRPLTPRGEPRELTPPPRPEFAFPPRVSTPYA